MLCVNSVSAGMRKGIIFTSIIASKTTGYFIDVDIKAIKYKLNGMKITVVTVLNSSDFLDDIKNVQTS